MKATKENLSRLKIYIDETNASNSNNDKLAVLEKYKEDEFVKKVLYYTHNDFLQFRVTSKNLKKRKSVNTEQASRYGDDLFKLLDDLHNSEITGHAALDQVNAFILDHIEFEEILYNIIDRTLETRVTTSLINRVISDLIPTFDVALCESYDDQKKKPNFINEMWLSSQKLDGCRGVAVVDHESNANIFSRSGKPFDTLQEIVDEIKRLGIKDVVLDGEICMIDENGNDDFTAIMKEIKKKDHTIKNVRYKVFDVLTHEEFKNKTSKTPLLERLERGRQWINQTTLDETYQVRGYVTIEFLPQSIITTQEHFELLRSFAAEKGWEGLIIRKNVGYQGKRSKEILKVKNFFDAEYVVVDVEMADLRHIITEGEGTKEVTSPMLKSVIIEHKGHRVDVGSGFSIEERLKYYANPQAIIGKTITVQYFQETTNQEGGLSLRFPTVKAIYDGQRTI